MKKVEFKFQNKSVDQVTTLNGKKTTETVHFYTNGTSSCVCLQMSLIDRIRVLFGAPVWFVVRGGLPIFDLLTEDPFETKKMTRKKR